MERLDEARVRGELGRYADALQVRVLSQVDSTNARLKEGARTGAIHPPFLLAADYQTAGRGRRGKTFFSPEGAFFTPLSALGTGADACLAASASISMAISVLLLVPAGILTPISLAMPRSSTTVF